MDSSTRIASASVVTVDAVTNSRFLHDHEGVGAVAGNVTAGAVINITADQNDLWLGGPDLPYHLWSNANGQIGDLFANGADESGKALGTLIGTGNGLYGYTYGHNGNLTFPTFFAPYGALVGQIDFGAYFLVGTSYSGVASASGTLRLYYWDPDGQDNVGSINANVTIGAVPEPSTYALIGGLALVGFGLFRRQVSK